MADLKPLGSEKLEGQEQISRILEISNYGSKPTTLSENKNSKADYSIHIAPENTNQTRTFLMLYYDHDNHGLISETCKVLT